MHGNFHSYFYHIWIRPISRNIWIEILLAMGCFSWCVSLWVFHAYTQGSKRRPEYGTPYAGHKISPSRYLLYVLLVLLCDFAWLLSVIQCHFEAHQEEGMVISHMAVAGVGIWIAFTSGSTLRLFHTETLKHLQDVNVAPLVHNMLSGNRSMPISGIPVWFRLRNSWSSATTWLPRHRNTNLSSTYNLSFSCDPPLD